MIVDVFYVLWIFFHSLIFSFLNKNWIYTIIHSKKCESYLYFRIYFLWLRLSVKIESEGLPPDFLMLSNHKISAYIIISTTFHMEK